ncbi:MAG: hypothetical protein ACXABO_06145 [Promethearchaeota archaeon]|jgi:DNA-directed RNA polymerase subunit RPC12/RpoP
MFNIRINKNKKVILISETHYIECQECGKTHPYYFSKEEVKKYSVPSFENKQNGEIGSGIVPLIRCRFCGKEIQVSNFKPHNKI